MKPNDAAEQFNRILAEAGEEASFEALEQLIASNPDVERYLLSVGYKALAKARLKAARKYPVSPKHMAHIEKAKADLARLSSAQPEATRNAREGRAKD